MSEMRFRKLVKSNIIGFVIHDLQGGIQEANDAFLNALGYHQDEIIAQKLNMWILSGPEYGAIDQWVLEQIRSDGHYPAVEKEFIRRDGTRWPVLVGTLLLNEPLPHCISFIVDATDRQKAQNALAQAYNQLEERVFERTADLSDANAGLRREVERRKKAEAKLRSLSLRDTLTGLYNRRGFLALAEQHLQQARREAKSFLLFFADVDGLKQINDTLGHAQGDLALIQIAGVLQKTSRRADILSRLGGDEFAIVATKGGLKQQQAYVARMRDNLRIVNTTLDFPFLLSLSIGGAAFDPEMPVKIEDLMMQADRDLYRFKQSHHLSGVHVLRDHRVSPL